MRGRSRKEEESKGRSWSATVAKRLIRREMIAAIVRHANSELLALSNLLQISPLHYMARCT